MIRYEIEKSKNGFLIPVVIYDEKKIFLHSKYDPILEAKKFAQNALGKNFLIIFGLCAAYHINAIFENNPKCKIIAVEENLESLSFFEKFPSVQNAKKNPNLYICTNFELKKILKENYIPQLFGDLTILELRSWGDIFFEKKLEAKKIINDALKEISADFSVQAHFGKIWQKNIFLNLKLLKKSEFVQNSGKKIKIDTEKIAAIIAAGPTLDFSLEKIQKNREKYFVIACDTAFPILISKKIKVDATLSIDGQAISIRHFAKKIEKNTIFVFDLCAYPAAIRKVQKNGNPVFFFVSNHPLANFAKNFFSFPLEIQNGSGTVCFSCVFFAKSLGFKKIELFGADFSYPNGKPYAKGTYLDGIFFPIATRLESSEKMFAKLMFRTKLNEKKSNELLESYKKSVYELLSQKSQIKKIEFLAFQTFSEKSFKNAVQKALKNQEYSIILPLLAFDRSLNLAKRRTLMYTELL